MKSLICNLKMNHTLQEMIEYKKILEENQISSILLCPATCYLPLMHSKYYKLCAQNISKKDCKNNTGATSIEALKSLDVNSVLIGHSEIEDTIENIIEKTKEAIENNCHAYVILSDTKEDSNYQYTEVKLLEQIHKILSQIKKEKYQDITLIYEPVWLVGTKETLEIEKVNNTFFRIKETLKQEYHYEFPLFYGGGLTLENIKEYLSSSNIDGLLLGSVSFSVNNVVKLVKNSDFST